ncbi:MAG: hypothetical protein Q7S27_05370 [Nanoarchaeota archaeon]|nr:hypothetical protein [Nanoarchaeota archaeon]
MITKRSVYLFALLFVVGISGLTSGLSASIGNSRMVLRVGVEEEIQKSILVRNVNDVPVLINITVLGDLAENIILKESSFNLEPSEERKVYFLISADQAGKTESRISFSFVPIIEEGIGEGNGVGFSSVITVIADDQYKGQTESEDDDNYYGNNDIINKDGISSKISGKTVDSNKGKIFSANILIISTAILLGILIILYFLSLGTKYKRRVTKMNA